MTRKAFSEPLLQWHKRHGRFDLPWQKNRTPYRVWLAETMLQQTQVSTVLPYYQAFISVFPNLSRLAKADLDSVLQQWSGLGYYRRARHLHQCARIVAKQYHGRFPRSLAQLMELPGIGRSTAGAIMALAWSEPYPILDGNVKRVLCRYLGIETWPGEKATENRLWQWSQRYTESARDVASYTQAIMDLGATVCRRTQPLCHACPFSADCSARRQGKQQDIPVAGQKKDLSIKHTQMLLLYNQRKEILLLKRPPVGVWPNLWSLPECDATQDPDHWCHQNLGLRTNHWQHWQVFQHTFSHFKLRIQPRVARLQGTASRVMASQDSQWLQYKPDRKIAIATPVNRLLNAFFQWVMEKTHKP